MKKILFFFFNSFVGMNVFSSRKEKRKKHTNLKSFMTDTLK